MRIKRTQQDWKRRMRLPKHVVGCVTVKYVTCSWLPTSYLGCPARPGAFLFTVFTQLHTTRSKYAPLDQWPLSTYTCFPQTDRQILVCNNSFKCFIPISLPSLCFRFYHWSSHQTSNFEQSFAPKHELLSNNNIKSGKARIWEKKNIFCTVKIEFLIINII